MPECCVIIPCYNEAGRICSADFIEFVNRDSRFALLFVDDGSTDSTAFILRDLCAEHPLLKWISLPANRGKAEAVRAGMHHAAGNGDFRFLAYLDADLAIPLTEMARLYDLTKANPALEFTFLSKIRRAGAEVRQPARRFLMGRLLSIFTRYSLHLRIYDTQCGCKIISRDLAAALFDEPFISPWLFDIELFHRTLKIRGRNFCTTSVLEVPLNKLNETGSSRVSGKDIFRLPFEFLRIHRRYQRGSNTSLRP